ncbi:MAG TPA: cytochrome c [Bryobacteraceae bacterium]|nr:cytochrome c [Bryobacteraceae bacterium]
MWKKILGLALLSAVSMAGAGLAFLYYREPESRPARNVQVDMSSASIERGKYIYNLADCDGCHSPHDPLRYDTPPEEGKRGSGRVFNEPDMPGKIYTPNITPVKQTGIGTWSDGEKIRAIREGIGKHGQALFPLMPYENYRYMSDADVEALVAYLNSLPPVNHALPRTEVAFPVSMLMKAAPRPVDKPIERPDRGNRHSYGEYLVTVASCETCHTPMDKGKPIRSKRLAGGNVFREGPVPVVSANITPDRETGIGDWSFDRFRDRFYAHKDHAGKPIDPVKPERFSVMPWGNLSQLPEDDLAAIYQYLMTQPPIANKVVTHPDGGGHGR